ncbi:MAG: hypothetical protein ACTSQG_10645 [Promethearchaeota archaeon]
MKMPKKVKLYSNGHEDDRKAIALLLKENIPFVNYGPISESITPMLEYGYWRFYGYDAIEDFVRQWKEDKLPNLEL